MYVDDISAVLKEVRRVMKLYGVLLISLVHPFRDRGRFAGSEPEASFVLSGSYYGRVRFEGEQKLGGLRMQFAGWSQPLE
jgi:hypothetical protein